MNIMETELQQLMEQSRKISWNHFGKKISFYHPGMFRYRGNWGDYPALSITGDHCMLQCDHCQGKLLESMISVSDGEDLVQKCLHLEEKGNKGCLISGGSRLDGSLPWKDFLHGIETIKKKTELHISVHSGIVDFTMARRLKEAGVDQVLIDVIGDNDTFQSIYHCDFGVERIEESLYALKKAHLPIVPHIVIGLNYGTIHGEYQAIELMNRIKPDVLTFVSLMPLKGTPMQNTPPPSAEKIAHVIATARLKLPNTLFSLGCARERSNTKIELHALDSGINRMALPSDETIRKAQAYGLSIEWNKTCCSVIKKERDEK
jgi:hypothetical protein